MSVDKLIDFHDALPSLKLPPRLEGWLSCAFHEWRYEGKKIGDALGVSDSANERRKRRNDALRDFASQLPYDCSMTKSVHIEKEIEKIDQNCNYQNRTVNHILKSIDLIYRLPRKRRQIFNILQSTPMDIAAHIMKR